MGNPWKPPIPWLHVDFRRTGHGRICFYRSSNHDAWLIEVQQSDIEDVIFVYGWCQNSLTLTQLSTRVVDHLTFPTWTQPDSLIFKTLSCHVAYQGAVFFIAFGSGHQHSRPTVFQQIAVQDLVVNCENPHVEDQDLTRSWSLTLS